MVGVAIVEVTIAAIGAATTEAMTEITAGTMGGTTTAIVAVEATASRSTAIPLETTEALHPRGIMTTTTAEEDLRLPTIILGAADTTTTRLLPTETSRVAEEATEVGILMIEEPLDTTDGLRPHIEISRLWCREEEGAGVPFRPFSLRIPTIETHPEVVVAPRDTSMLFSGSNESIRYR